MPLDAALPPSLKATLDDFRRRLANLERSPRLTSASIRGGLLRILDPDGKPVALLGSWTDAVGVARTVVASVRRDGKTPALYMGRTDAGDQFTSFVDKASRIVVSDDAVTGGLATPWIPIYPAPSGPVKETGYVYQETSEANPRQLFVLYFYQQHPRLFLTGDVWSEGGTSYRLELVDIYDGDRVLASQDGSGQGFFQWTIEPATLGSATKVQTWRGLSLRISRLSGAGRTGARIQAAYGIQSA